MSRATTLSEKQKEIYEQLKKNGWNKSATARATGYGERDIYRCATKLKTLGYEVHSNPNANNKFGRHSIENKIETNTGTSQRV